MPDSIQIDVISGPSWQKIEVNLASALRGWHRRIAVKVPDWISALCAKGLGLMLLVRGERPQIRGLLCAVRCTNAELPEDDRVVNETLDPNATVLVCFFVMTQDWTRPDKDPLRTDLEDTLSQYAGELGGVTIHWWDDRSEIVDLRHTLEDAVRIADEFVAAQNAAFQAAHNRLPDLRHPADYPRLDWAGMLQTGTTICGFSNLGHRMLLDYARRCPELEPLGGHLEDALLAFMGLTHYISPPREDAQRLVALLRLKAAVAAGSLTLGTLTQAVRDLMEIISAITPAFDQADGTIPRPEGVSEKFWLGIFFRQSALNWLEGAQLHLQPVIDGETEWFDSLEAHLLKFAQAEADPHATYR